MDDRVTSAQEFLATVAELIDTPTGACAYAAALPLSDLPIETQDVPPPDAIGGARRRQHNLWIGSGNHVVDLHFDMMRNFIAMLAGRKRITLFPPEALPHIYPAPLHRRVAGVTRSLVKTARLGRGALSRFPTRAGACRKPSRSSPATFYMYRRSGGITWRATA